MQSATRNSAPAARAASSIWPNRLAAVSGSSSACGLVVDPAQGVADAHAAARPLGPAGLLVGAQQCQCHRQEHADDALAAAVPVLLAHLRLVAAEQLFQQLARAAHAGLVELALDRRQHDLLDHRLDDVVARDPKALAKVLGRLERAIGLDMVGRDHQVRGAAADVEARDPKARLRLRARCRLAARHVDERPRLAHRLDEGLRLAAEFLRDLGVQPDELGAARLVPVDRDLRPLGADAGLAAEQVPDQADAGLDPAAHDLLLLQGRRRRQGQDHVAKAARHIRFAPPVPHRRVVDQHQRLVDDLGDHEAVER